MGLLTPVIWLYIVLQSISVFYINGHVIDTRLGRLEGFISEARYNKTFYSYIGIPYAKPPIGDLRFKPPVKADQWNGTFDATLTPERCPQLPDGTDPFDGSEDCLYVNVYTPKDAKAGSNYPVIFYIFGGIFRYGQITTNLGPEYFMSRDIVMVMVSYRLGALGFLSTGDSVVSGNMGLKDQAMALRWAKDNIFDFGGDPDRITLMGHSSGAGCVHLHTLSPLSKDYFNRAIMQSGLGVNPQMFADKDVARGTTKALCERMNCSTESSIVMLQCLNAKTAQEIVEAAATIQIWQNEPDSVFRPTIEDVEGAFLQVHPIFSPYQSTGKEWLLGMTSGEAASYVSWSLDADPKLYLPLICYFEWTAKPKDVEHIQQIIKTHFFGDEDISPSTDLALVEMVTGCMHGMGLIHVVENYLGTKYVYVYDYRGGYTNQPTSPTDKFRGVAHADEIYILFLNDKDGVTEDDLEFGDEMITRWVNFAYSGDPNIPFPINKTVFAAWNPVSSKRLEYLVIKKNGTMQADHLVRRFHFWKNIPFFSKYL